MVGASVVVAALLFAACSSSTSTPQSNGTSVPTGGTKIQGGTASYAEGPSATPNFIFPFIPPGFASINNTDQFQYLMYRPLYWFGVGTEPSLNTSLSLAATPVYSNNNTTLSITMNPYKWSNGETVTAQDVAFFLNMLHSEKAEWYDYIPGFFPDNVTSVVVNSSTELTITLNGSVNPDWNTYNNLSQITPMPKAWDITSANAAPGSGGCFAGAYGTAATDAACKAVWTFLATQAGFNPTNPMATNNSFGTYATNPLWQVVDGPWHLTAFNSTGAVTMEPNPTYSGPVKATLAKFEELPYTTNAAEYSALLGGQVSVGYMPIEDTPKSTTNALQVPENSPRLSNYYVNGFYIWGINYFPDNFNSTGDGGYAGKIISQLYFRQALQSLIDQPLIISKIDKGYGVPTYGPVGTQPASSFTSPGDTTDQYPYSVSAAENYLKSHGWKIVAGGTDTCTDPGSGSTQCGAGIPAGTPLNFNIQYQSGNPTLTNTVNTEVSAWSEAGIHFTATQATFDTVIANATACTPSPSCTWEFQNWGGGWSYSPDVYPTGEVLFETGAAANYGNYSDPMADALIKATNNTTASLTGYEDYLAKTAPVVWQPAPVQELTETVNNLRGTVPQNVLWTLNPENWYYVSK